MYNDGVFMMDSFNRDAMYYSNNADEEKILKAGASIDLDNINQTGVYIKKDPSYFFNGDVVTSTTNKYVDLNALEVFKEEIRKKIETGEWRQADNCTPVRNMYCIKGRLRRSELLTLRGNIYGSKK